MFNMPLVGQPAPQFDAQAVVNGTIVDVNWEWLHASGWLVLMFYPYDFTFVCPTEVTAFSDAIPRFQEMGAKLVGISVDSAYCHYAWLRTPRNKGGLGGSQLALISDLNRQISRRYGVLLEDEGVALRGLFIVDPGGFIRHATINDLGVGRNVEETLRILGALQHVDEHGEFCPANWTPGSETVVPDPEQAQAYFAKLQ